MKPMENLDGLWRDKKGRVLVRLYTTKMFVRCHVQKKPVVMPVAQFVEDQMVKCTLRVIRGHNIEKYATDGLTLVSVLPKRRSVIMLTSLEKRPWSYYWRMEGLIALVAEGIVLEKS